MDNTASLYNQIAALERRIAEMSNNVHQPRNLGMLLKIQLKDTREMLMQQRDAITAMISTVDQLDNMLSAFEQATNLKV